ncbi:MAG: cysteine dioxygenase [Ilumatobacteraceae bacterium]|nr:cysteine dioxygenase [Ilumatobacteraceae bacterium]
MALAAQTTDTRQEASIDIDVLSTIARGIAAATLPWERRDGTVPSERCYERLLLTDAYEVWVICWPGGGALDLHDHGGSSGAFAVVSGCLDEARVHGGQIDVRRLAPGDSAEIAHHVVHAVANRSPAPATSVHVYSPPLDRMGFYHRDAEGRLTALEP